VVSEKGVMLVDYGAAVEWRGGVGLVMWRDVDEVGVEENFCAARPGVTSIELAGGIEDDLHYTRRKYLWLS
jgi:hypothetical protein